MSEKPPTKLSHPQSPSYSAVQSKGVTGKGASGPEGSSPDGPLQQDHTARGGVAERGQLEPPFTTPSAHTLQLTTKPKKGPAPTAIELSLWPARATFGFGVAQRAPLSHATPPAPDMSGCELALMVPPLAVALDVNHGQLSGLTGPQVKRATTLFTDWAFTHQGRVVVGEWRVQG